MQKNDFYKCIVDSKALNAACVNQLESLVAEAPYFQLAWMLLAKAKNNTLSSDYHKVLGQTAARVFNREQLFDFIYAQEYENEKPAVESKKVYVNSTKTEATASNKEGSKKQIIDKPKTKTLVAKKHSLKEVAKPQAPKPIIKKSGEEVRSKEDLRAVVKERLAEIEKEKAVKEKKENQLEKQGKSSPSKKSNLDIIESFIKQNPVINKPKDAEYKEELAVAKKSLDDKLDFVSETLAEINLKQGHAEKAIKIYEKLSLKYPEKSSYFAAQIKKVKLNK